MLKKESNLERRKRIRERVAKEVRRICSKAEDEEFTELVNLGYSEEEAERVVKERTERYGALGRGRSEIQPKGPPPRKW